MQQAQWSCHWSILWHVLLNLASVTCDFAQIRTVVRYLGCTCKPTSCYLWLSSKGILDLFKACLEGPGLCWHDFPLASHLAGGTWIWWQSCLCLNCYSECLDWPTWNFRHVSNIFDSDSSVFKDEVLSIWHLQLSSHHFWSWKTAQKLSFFSLSPLQKLLSIFQKDEYL